MAHGYGPQRPMGPGATAPAAPPIVTPMILHADTLQSKFSVFFQFSLILFLNLIKLLDLSDPIACYGMSTLLTRLYRVKDSL